MFDRVKLHPHPQENASSRPHFRLHPCSNLRHLWLGGCWLHRLDHVLPSKYILLCLDWRVYLWQLLPGRKFVPQLNDRAGSYFWNCGGSDVGKLDPSCLLKLFPQLLSQDLKHSQVGSLLLTDLKPCSSLFRHLLQHEHSLQVYSANPQRYLQLCTRRASIHLLPRRCLFTLDPHLHHHPSRLQKRQNCACRQGGNLLNPIIEW